MAPFAARLETLPLSIAERNLVDALKRDKRDLFAKLMLGNVLATKARKRAKQDPNKAREYLQQAAKHMQSVLRAQPTNVCAANGLAGVLATMGHTMEAKEMFATLREAGDTSADSFVNQAHVFAAHGQYVNAIKNVGACSFPGCAGNGLVCFAQYEQALSRSGGRADVGIMRYLARVLYLNGQLQEAKRWLVRAIHLVPHEPSLQYNLGLVLEQSAVETLQKPKAARSYEEVRRAVTYLEQAHE